MTEALADAGSSSHAGGLVLFGRVCCAGSECLVVVRLHHKLEHYLCFFI